jgi:hypothetical protein
MGTFVLYLTLAGTLGYLIHIAITWWEYGMHLGNASMDPLLDRFLPDWEVAERHETQVYAPLDLTYLAFRSVDFEESPVIRLIFHLRQFIMRGKSAEYRGPRTVLDRALAMGWGILEDVPGRTLVLGAVTRPWQAAPVFRPLPPEEFVAFNEPGYAKIVWSMGADESGWNRSTGRTETRVKLTDPGSRKRFRLYWALVSPGVFLIRKVLLRRVRKQAERWSLANPPIGLPVWR